MWRLDTDRGSHAVKQLSASLDLEDPRMLHDYNVSEAVAEAFAKRGIPAVFALEHAGDYLQLLEGVGYLVYPWRDAANLGAERISEPHALQVAGILARMHATELSFPDLRHHEFDMNSGDNIAMLVDLAQALHTELADTLRRGLPSFLEIVDAQTAAIRALRSHVVVCHGDLDQKNVLWDRQGEPALIDWESARQLNPTYELLLEALNWSGIWSRFDRELCKKFMAAYRAAGGVIEEEAVAASYHCILGDWVYWLMYNVGRCLDTEDAGRRIVGEKQVSFALAVLQRIMDHVPGLLSVHNPGGSGSARSVDV
jgi:thiamine kinase-like enzyme